jgi:hypothetical protein
MKIKIFLMIAIVLIGSSCSQKSYTYRSTTISNPNVLVTDLVVDIDTDFSKRIISNSTIRKTLKEAKDEAYYKAIVENNIDIVVDPIFEITHFGKKFQVKLTGFGAKYTNPRTKIEAIKELKTVDTTDVRKYQMLYEGQIVEKKTKSIVLNNPVAKENNIFVTNGKPSKPKSTFGAKLGYSSCTFKADGTELFSGGGTNLGVFIESNEKSKLGLRVDMGLALYEQIQEFSLPFYLKFSFTDKLSLNAGLYSSYIYYESEDLEVLSVGASGGLSYKISGGLSADFFLYAPFTSTSTLDNDVEFLNNSFSLGISYRF